MRELVIAFAFASSVIVGSANPAKAEVIFHVGEGQDCPKFTKSIDDGYCKAIVNNKFIGAYLNGGCPPNSGPVSQGYCMYD